MKDNIESLFRYNIAEDFWLQKVNAVVYRQIFDDPKKFEDSSTKVFDRSNFSFPVRLAGTMNEITGGSDAKILLLFITALNVLIYKYTGINDILISTTEPQGDTPEEAKNILMFFRSMVNGDSISRKLLNTALIDLKAALEHRYFEYESFFSRFCTQNVGDKEALIALGLIYDNFNNVQSPFADEIELLFRITKHNGEFVLIIQYDTQCYRQEQIDQLGQHFLNVLILMMEDLDSPVKNIDMLSPEDKWKLCVDLAGEEVHYSSEEQTFLSCFQRQVEKTPQSLALVYENVVLTYRELDEISNRLARNLLKTVHIGVDDLAAIVMERSEKMVESILAVWKCGAAYIPIDTGYPEDRIKTIVKDSGAKLVISETGLISSQLEKALESVTKIAYLDKIKEYLSKEDNFSRHTSMHSSNLAYVIYTSGSTGNPKGAMIEHRGMMNHMHAKIAELQIHPGSVIAQNASHCFDISVWQFFSVLLKGGKTVIYSNRVILNPETFIKQLGENRVNILEVVPSYLSMMLDIMEDHKSDHLFPKLNYLLVTGESVKPGLVRRWFEKFPGIKMVNAYGPTEASDDITHFHMDRYPGTKSIPIGKTLRNLCIYIVDNLMALCPIGVKGEICVSGVGIGRGYLNNLELTADKFINIHHHSSFVMRHSVLYRTGDVGRFLPDGNIEFFGRKDYQVKVRGYRIELEEIENKLSNMEGVRSAAVIVREDKTSNTYLCGYITLREGSGKSVEEIKLQLRKTLPDYMVPSFIIVLDVLPLTPNGKVDRKALPSPDEFGMGYGACAAPRNAIEKKLVEIWRQEIGIERIGIYDDFFALGGNSLLGIRIVNKIQEWLQETVHVTILFLAPTIEKLAMKLESYKIEKDTRINDPDIAEMRRLIQPLSPLPSHLTSPGKKTPVMFILCPLRSGSTLLRVILAGHSKLFAPQEFELLSFNTLPERKEALSGKLSLYLEGVIRAIMEIKKVDADESKEIMDSLESQGITVQEFYGILQSWLGDRILVDKTPQYAFDLKILQRAEAYFDSPLYIHLIRNPYAVIHSYENARLDQLFRYENRFSARELGELQWIICHQNILEFLGNIPVGRKYRLKYEDLVGNPEYVVSQMCNHFGLEFDRKMIDIYADAGNRMTDGIYAESKMLGDVKFFTHSSIDTKSVEKWRDKYKTEFLGEEAVKLAKYFGYLRERTEYSKIEPAVQKEYYKLSPAQLRLWVLNRLDENNVAYNIPKVLYMEGNLDIPALEKSYETVLKRHEGLRTTFITVEGEPQQKIHDFESIGYKLDYVDLRSEKNCEKQARNLLIEEAWKVFDLEKGPLLRTKLIHIDENRYMFLFAMHHIISDGWSMNLLVKEILALYRAYTDVGENPLPLLQFQYKDYSEWLNSDTMQREFQGQGEFWLKEFAGEIPVLNLPTDYLRPSIMSFEGSAIGFDLNAEVTRALSNVARSEGATLFMVLTAVFNIFLSKISGQEDIVVGIPVAGRNHPDLEQIIGMFVNTLAIRNYLMGEMLFTEFLHQVRIKMLDVFSNQGYSFETLVEKIGIKRDMSRNPLFDVMFSVRDDYEASPFGGLPGHEIKDLEIKPYILEHPISKFDLSLNASELDGRLYFYFEYCNKLFREETIRSFIQYFRIIVSAVARNPLTKILKIDIITEEEKRRILYDFNGAEKEYPNDKTIHLLFEEQVTRTPDHIALVGGAPCGYPSSLTYRELNKKSNRLAHMLRGKGVHSNTIVGILIERSIEMMVGIQGILKAGGAYLPIATDYPPERVQYMLEDSESPLVLTRTNLAGSFKFKGEVIDIETGCKDGDDRNVEIKSSPRDMVYMIYTSGSTGKPKGVMVKIKGFVNLLHWYVEEFGIEEKENILIIAPISFDLAQKNLFSAHMVGGRLTLAPPGIPDYRELTEIIHKEQITLINCAPSVFYPLVELNSEDNYKSLKSLQWIILGGEPIQVEKLQGWVKSEYYRSEIVNTYGPTECTDITTSYRIPKETIEQKGIIPIGKPIPNVNVYILDKNQGILPVKVAGELCVGGIGLGKGYYNNKKLTKEKFIETPHLPEKKVYRTGDLTRWLPDGNIEFLGRIDHQVKIRGNRVELGEIESELSKHEEIDNVVVVARESEKADNYLCAYIVSRRELGITELREYLGKSLPEYMIPAYFTHLDKIPLTPNGKVDRRALPFPEVIETGNYVAPRDTIEEKLVEIWSEILEKQTSIGIDDNFFHLGGHSLKATVLVSKTHKNFNVNLPLEEVFKTPTIRGLSGYIKESAEVTYSEIEAVETKEYYALSSAQKRLHFLNQLDKDGTSYNMPAAWTLDGILDRNKLEEAFLGLIKRHESLRTSFEMIDEEPVQRIRDEVDFKIEYIELAKVFGGVGTIFQKGSDPSETIIKSFIHPFNLSKAPLMRVGLVRIEEEQHIMMVDMNHIISDGISVGALIRDFTSLYSGKELRGLKLQYKDYTEWRNREKGGENYLKQSAYWKTEFEGEIPVLELPTDYSRPIIQSFEGNAINFEIHGEIIDLLKTLTKETGTTLYMALLAFYNVFLSKVSGSEDIVIGSPVAGRRHADLEQIIGMFVNTLALRNNPSGEKGFVDFLKDVKGKTLKALENQDYQYEELVEQFTINRDTGRNPLFDTMFALQNTGAQKIEIPGLELIPYEFEHKTSKFDLSLIVEEAEEKLLITFEYSTRLFKEETIERFIEYFKNVVKGLTKNKDRRISEIEIITEEEKKRILFNFNDTEREYPKDKTIHLLFEEQVARTPDRIALVGAAPRGCQTCLTYRELNEKSNNLAYSLQEKGVGYDTIVAINLERSVEMIIGILGILKSGAAYLPIDPNYPQERIDYMIKDSGTKIIIDKSFWTNLFTKRLAAGGIPLTLSLNSNTCYVIYTSGSTGKQKGVIVEHQSVVNLLYSLQEEYPFNESDVYLLKTSYIFDVSVAELFGWYMGGGRVAVLEKDGHKDPRVILDWIERYIVTHLNFVPSMFNAFVEHITEENKRRISNLKFIFLAGEALLPELVMKFNELGTVISLKNLYGPTESTVYSSKYSLSDWDGIGSILIGKPIPNIELYIIDKNMQPVGIPGELCISGIGLARGYLNRPELTSERFISTPNTSTQYKTGDLARWLESGNIEYLGRMDRQVKIRGFRIELGEIENELSKHEDIKDAVVVPRESEKGSNYLCAYIVGRRELGITELRGYLGKSLPEYMIPAYFTHLDKIPLTPSGKIDRRALPVPEVIETGNYVAPRDSIEEKLVEIWSEILEKQASIGIDDNFFHLGGHSLKATTLVSKIHKQFNVNLPLGEVFKSPTIRGLSEYIKESTETKYNEIGEVETKEYYALSSAQRRLHFLIQMDKSRTSYNMPAAWTLEGVLDRNKLEEAFVRLIERHESLRTSFETIDEELVQRIHNEVDFKIEYDYLTERTENTEKKIHHFLHPFNLSKAPLMRVGLVRVEEEKHILMVDMSHIISDGISMGVLIRDFITYYTGKELRGLKQHYKDYAEWRNREKEEENYLKQSAYWKTEFEGETPVLELQTDYSRPTIQSFEGNTINFEIRGKIIDSLNALTKETGTTLYMLLLALYSVFLSKISGSEDIIIGTPVAGRRHADVENIIGMFVNTLALRNYPSGEKVFNEFLHEVSEKTLKALENQDYQYEELVEQLRIERDISRNPLFNTMFALQNTGSQEMEIPGLKLAPYKYENKTSKFDITLIAVEVEDKLLFTCEYCARLFKQETIDRFISYFKKIVNDVIENKEQRISEIEIITENEKKQILYDFNNTEKKYPKDKTIHLLFEEQVARTPDHIAVVNSSQQIAYKELDEKSNNVAFALKEKGAHPETIVGIKMERSVEMIIGILGILKSGAAYLPIDPDYPQDRIDFMIKDSNTKIIIDKSFWKSRNLFSKRFLAAGGINIAYVIYTSGSTGRPKGVLVRHTSFVNLINYHQSVFEENQDSRMSQVANPAFDAMGFEVWPCLSNGASLHIAENETRLSPEKMRNWLIRQGITISFQPTILAEHLLEEKWPDYGVDLKSLCAAGDKLSRYPEREYPFELYNLYGPTEDTVWTTWTLVEAAPDNEKSPCIGKPVANHKVYILNSNLNLQPVGVSGELCISGVGLAEGYLNNPELTRERFIMPSATRYPFEKGFLDLPKLFTFNNPKPKTQNPKLYRSGDLARWLDNGNLEYLGRIDRQVKIRGFRIELGEIETRLLSHENVKEGVVIVRENRQGEKYIIAYIIGNEGLNITGLKSYLSGELPEYMIPSYFVKIEKIPLNQNGKIDHKALPEPELIDGEEYVGPRNEIEEELVQIWSEVLGIEKRGIGIDRSFFQLGGHSLKATKLVTRIHKKLDVQISLTEIFKIPTIRELACCIKRTKHEAHKSIFPVEKKEYYKLSFAQKSIFILSENEHMRVTYNIPIAITITGKLDIKRLENAFQLLSERHESLRTSFEWQSGEPVQRIHEKAQIRIDYKEALENEVSTIVKNFIRPFDLKQAPLLRLELIRLGEENHVILYDMHHIISDGVSMGIFVKEFIKLYDEAPLFPLVIQYKDFSEWQTKWFREGRQKELEHYWLNIFDGEVPVLNMPTDYPRPSIKDFKGNTVIHEIDRQLADKVKMVMKETETTLYMVLLAVFSILLSMYTGQDDIIVGCPIAGRNHTDLENVIGMFVNTLAMRNFPGKEKLFRDFLEEVKKNALMAFENQDYPFNELVSKLNIPKDYSRNPLFDILVVSEKLDIPKLELMELTFTPYKFENNVSHMDMVFYMLEIDERIELKLEYTISLFKQSGVEGMLKHYVEILEQVIYNTSIKLDDIKISHDFLAPQFNVLKENRDGFGF